MKKKICLCLLALLCLLLPGCGQDGAAAEPPTIRVGVVEQEHVTVTNNGLWLESGQDVTFIIWADEGYLLDATDYPGEYDIWQKDHQIRLTLHAVRYPTEVRLHLLRDGYTIRYEPNGGDGFAQTLYYDREFHLRPNTSIGTDLFSREGYTLLGWNTAPDGSGTAVGLGSRVTMGEGPLTLFAQWAEWTPETDFQYIHRDGVCTILKYTGTDKTVVIPETIQGVTVTTIAPDAFAGSAVTTVVLPKSLVTVADGAFRDSALETLYLYDNIEVIGDGAVAGCQQFTTLHINAIEPPYGYNYRRESIYADKVDLLILAQGQKKLVCYSGCSIWYNLDIPQMKQAFPDYTILDLGLNGTVSSEVQLQILAPYLEEGDVFFHTPELSSVDQMMTEIDMEKNDRKLWCGIEYNYDLMALVDMRAVSGVLDSFQLYLDMKSRSSSYQEQFQDSFGREYCGGNGEIPFERDEPMDELYDNVYLEEERITQVGLERLGNWYGRFQDMGVKVYVSYACVNLDVVPEEQKGNVEAVDARYREAFGALPGVTVISHLQDYLFSSQDFYDTNYHLLSESARRNTRFWVRDLTEQMLADGLLEGDGT